MKLDSPGEGAVPKDPSNLLRQFPIDLQKVYPRSFRFLDGLIYGLVRTSDGRKFVVLGEDSRVLKDPFQGKCYHHLSTLKVCELSADNTECLMSLFPHTKPVSVRKYPVTFGAGDRLGVATPGHIRAIRNFKVRPVLAQQSVRENTNTGRNFISVLRDAAWGVFQEDYQGGYGADGDHLKSIEQVRSALEAGVSMVTLDLTEKLNPEAFHDPREVIDRKFAKQIDKGDAEVLFHLLLDRDFRFEGSEGSFSIHFDEDKLKRNALLFHEAIDFTEEMFEFIRSKTGNPSLIDFEISIDETPFPTSPENHLFFAIASGHRGVRIDSLAPRFVGEFQKGVDYRGRLGDFRTHFYQHALIARDYGGYKISIHSGSDKFSIFPIAGVLAAGGLHVKTAGTSWLEAAKLIAASDPPLYREMHRFALSTFEEAAKSYHVTTDLKRIPKVEDLSDEELPGLFDEDDSRQLLHITYGFLLNAKDVTGKNLFRDRFFRTLTEHEEDYWFLLEKHIGRHLDTLGVQKGEET